MMDEAAAGPVFDAKRFAALSGVYDPAEALPAAVRGDPVQATIVASALALASDTNPDTGQGWLLRLAERRFVLDTLRRNDALDTAVAERRRGSLDPATVDLLDAIDGADLFAPDRVAATIADPDVTSATIERIVTALDRTDGIAPGMGSLKAARIRLAELTEAARRDGVAARGFFGRAEERATLAAWVATATRARPVTAALVTGSPGIGKSALLDAVAGDAVDGQHAIVVRLDFDRAGLDILDLRGLTMEVARQLAERIGAEAEGLLDSRLAAARVDGASARYEKSARAGLPAELVAAIGAAVAQAARPVVLVLDTLEVLRARGERHVGQLFDWLDRLLSGGMAPLAVIAAGRGDVFDTCPDRRGPGIALGGLDPDAAAALLDRLDVPATARASVIDLADGCPLVMRLAARVLAAHGRLPRRRLDSEVTTAFLYRFLLSRIVDPDLRRLAHPGLIVRRLSADVLREVLAPQLGMKGMTSARAQALFDALAGEHWLVERDPVDPLFVRHRGDMRALLLPMLYDRRPAQCARIDAAAMRWFGARTDIASQVDAAYHSLQGMRSRRRAPLVDADIARRIDPDSVAELPTAARAVVERARGGRSAAFRGDDGARGAADTADAVQVLQHLVDTGDWQEGRYVVEQIEAGGLDPRGIAADAVRAFHWRAGHWEAAWQLLAGRDRLGADDAGLADLPPQLALARLEMRAEFDPASVRMPAFDNPFMLMAQAAHAPGSLARHGALGFLIAVHGGHRPASGGEGNPVDATMELRMGQEGSTRSLAFGRARDRLLARGVSPADLAMDDSRLLATLSPYPVFVANLATQADMPLDADARDADARLARAGGLIGAGPLVASETNAIAGIADLGLFAEWVGIAAWSGGDPDLRRIARAAERWRRTVAGDWAYGRTPHGWQDEGPIDATLGARVADLHGARRPRVAALAQLSIWARDGDGERLWRTLQRRFAAGLSHAATIDSAVARAAYLRRRLPAALVPAAAILIHSSRGET